MPPIRPLEDAFLAHLLEPNENLSDDVLKTNINIETLTTTLQKLNSTSRVLQQELYQHVLQHFEPFSRRYNNSQAIHSHMYSITQQLLNTESKVQDARQKTTKSIEVYEQMWKASRINNAKLNALQQIKRLLQEEKTVHQYLETNQYLEAADHLNNLLVHLLQQWEQEEAGDGHIIDMFKHRLDELKQTLVTNLQDNLRTAIQFSHGCVKVFQSLNPSSPSMSDSKSSKTVLIRDLFYCLHQLGLLPEELMTIQHSLFKNIFNIYFECKDCIVSTESVEEKYLGEGTLLKVNGRHPNSGDNTLTKNGDMDVENQVKATHTEPLIMFNDMKSILSFLCNTFFEDGDEQKNNEMKRIFGKLLMPDLMTMMIDESIAPAVPSNRYNLHDFEPIAKAATEFERHCEQYYGFDVITDSDVTTLRSYINNIDKHYALKRSGKILQEGRNVMVRRLYDTDKVEEQTDRHTYKYQVTQTPQLLSVLISDTFSEAATLQADGHLTSAKTLIEGIRDLLDMYRAIMPSFHRTHYLSSAANSLIFRNDCYWLANQLTFSILNLPEAQQQHFNQSITYLKDASIYLQELGNAWYELALMRCFRTLQSVLETLDGFTGMAENMKFQKDCDHAMSKIIELVGSYAAEIQSVVDEQTLFLDILGRIVDYVLNYLIQDIESLVDIGADESHIIAQNLNRLMGLVGAFDLPGQDATENLIINLVPSWQKFWLLKDILEMNMRDIMDAFRRGKLHMFEKSEMIGLLCSLFADTELREMNIKEIQEGSSYSTRLATDNESANSGLHPTIAAAEDQTLPTPTTGVSPPTSTITSYRPNMTTAPATLTDTKLHLNYSPDDMDIDAAAEGWGIDDDDTLFDNQDLPTGSADKIDEEENDTKKAATIDHSTISSSSSSVFPQKNHLAIMAGETDIEEATADGWADDDDDDLFRVERYLCKDDDEEDTDTKEINISKQPKIAVKERPETAMTSSSPLTIRDDIQDEEENDGWDDDELLFDEEDLR